MRYPRHPYRNRILCIALCQGAALHFVDRETGVKDFDVYTFFARHPKHRIPHRRHVRPDFGASKFGRRRRDAGFEGRPVDLFWRALPVGPGGDPEEAVRDWLRSGHRNSTPWYLAQKAVVLLEPRIGDVIWQPERA